MRDLATRRVDLAIGFARDLAHFSGRKGVAAVTLAMVSAFAEAAAIGLVAPLLATLAGAALPARVLGRSLDRLGFSSAAAQLAAVLVAIGVLWIARSLLVWARDAALGTLMINFAEAQRRCIVDRLAAAPWNHLAALSPVRITHVLGQDVMRISIAAQALIQALVACVMVLALATAALLLAPSLAAVALVVLAGTGLGLARLLRRAHDVGMLVTRANLHVAEASARFLGGLRVAASQNLQHSFVTQFDAGLATVRAEQIDYMNQQSTARLMLSSVALASGAAVAVIGHGWLDVPLPLLATLILLLSRLSGPLGQIQQLIQQFLFALPAYGELKGLAEDIGAGIPAPAPAVVKSLPHDAILHVDAVSFSYSRGPAAVNSAPVLASASLRLLPGEMLGLTGSSGAGKSTLADLIVGLLSPGAGKIQIGAVPITGQEAIAWREQIAYATQEPFLFRDSLRANLTWGARAPDDAALWAALETTAMADAVRALPDGLETVIGDRGASLSGGERQRLALARALLRGGSLLVLDEATSSIDVKTESRIFAALRATVPKRTMLVIAHRAETLSFCDRVLRLVDGRIEPER